MVYIYINTSTAERFSEIFYGEFPPFRSRVSVTVYIVLTLRFTLFSEVVRWLTCDNDTDESSHLVRTISEIFTLLRQRNWLSVFPEKKDRGWPLLTVETEVNGDSKSTNERVPFLVGSLGSLCQNKICFSSPYTISLPLSPSPSKLGRQPCWVTFLLVFISGLAHVRHQE